MLSEVKLVLRQTGDDFDGEILSLIEDCKADLLSIGIRPDDSLPLVRRAIKLYCRMHFGQPEDYERLKNAYDEMRAQLKISRGYRLEA